MLKSHGMVAAATAIGACLTAHLEAQQKGATPTATSTRTCTRPDGVFIDMWSEDAVKAGGVRWQGREKLREIASGANVTGAPCTSSRVNRSVTHMILSLVITPAVGGATGNAYMVQLGGRDPNRITRMGNYEDVYVKTAGGWRFKTRTHSRAPNGTLPAPVK
jgi:hypothetical protein